MRAAFSLGWPPSEFWAASLWELETALALRIEQAEATRRTEALGDDDMRAFYAKLDPHA